MKSLSFEKRRPDRELQFEQQDERRVTQDGKNGRKNGHFFKAEIIPRIAGNKGQGKDADDQSHRRQANARQSTQGSAKYEVSGNDEKQRPPGNAADFVAKWTLDMADGSDTRPIEFIDTAGCSFDEKVNPETLSSYNPEEYFVLRQHLDNLLTLASTEKRPSIAIISPYREQVQFIQDHIKKDFDHYPDDDISVDTIDSFQGQERDVVYISLVRSNSEGEIGFLKDTRRMNVAMTRAKKKLVVIGDSATLGSFKFYSRFLDYCELHGCYATAWEWM